MTKKYSTVGEYFASLPPKARKILSEVRKTIKKSVPKADEVISYNIPAFRLNGILIWYASFKEHISIFPKTSAIRYFNKELSKYEVSKGTIKFPLNQPVPLKLIKKIVEFRINEQNKSPKIKNSK